MQQLLQLTNEENAELKRENTELAEKNTKLKNDLKEKEEATREITAKLELVSINNLTLQQVNEQIKREYRSEMLMNRHTSTNSIVGKKPSENTMNTNMLELSQSLVSLEKTEDGIHIQESSGPMDDIARQRIIN
jgi:hypothetical protein